MAEHRHGTFGAFLWRICAAGRPIMSSLSSPIPFRDWAKPSQDLVDSAQLFTEATPNKTWSSCIRDMCLRNEEFNREDCMPPVSMAPICSTFSPREEPTERQGYVKIALDSMVLSDRSNSTNRSSTEQASSVINCVSPCRNNADHVAELDDRSLEKKVSFGDECTGTISAAIPSSQVAVSSEKRFTPDDVTALPSLIYSYANVGCSPRAAANSVESESGWTAYLNSSTDYWTVSESVLVRNEIGWQKRRGGFVADSKHRNLVRLRRNQENACDDSSIVSDASSGPERPLLASRLFEGRLRSITPLKRSHKNMLDGSHSAIPRRAKPRTWSGEHQIPVTSDFQDTASSPVENQRGREEAVPAFDTCFDFTMNPKWLAQGHTNDVTGRLEALQALLPNAKELNEEEMLTVAIDYVKALELRVKMLKNAVLGDDVNPSAREDGGIGASRVLSALHEKDLCLMPSPSLGNTPCSPSVQENPVISEGPLIV